MGAGDGGPRPTERARTVKLKPSADRAASSVPGDMSKPLDLADRQRAERLARIAATKEKWRLRLPRLAAHALLSDPTSDEAAALAPLRAELDAARADYAKLRRRLIAQERSPQRAELVAQFRAAAERLHAAERGMMRGNRWHTDPLRTDPDLRRSA